MFETSLHEDKGLVWLSVALDQDDFFKKMISSKGEQDRLGYRGVLLT